jgi:dienelactone hydrolase
MRATPTAWAAAIDALAERLGPDAPIAVLGFSFGAACCVWATAKREALRAAVVYYGSLSGPSLSTGTSPVLGHFAESDAFGTDEGIAEFEQALRAGRTRCDHAPLSGHRPLVRRGRPAMRTGRSRPCSRTSGLSRSSAVLPDG